MALPTSRLGCDDRAGPVHRPGWSDAHVVAISAAGVTLSLVIAYFFYLAVERPFMTAYRRRGDAESLRLTQVREIPDSGPVQVIATGD